jgi:hypothetical protein
VLPKPVGEFNLRDEVEKIAKFACEKGFCDSSKDVLTITAGRIFRFHVEVNYNITL